MAFQVTSSLTTVQQTSDFGRLQTQDPTLLSLWTIFDKVRNGHNLSSDEVQFLEKASTYSYSIGESICSYFVTASDEASVGEINGLASRILLKKNSGKEALEQITATLLSAVNPTAKEVAALSGLIRSCATRQDSFDQVLAQFCSKKKRNPTRGELIDLVAKFNQEALPKTAFAGTAIAKVTISDEFQKNHREAVVRYNAEGLLEIIDGPVAPISKTPKQTLTSSQVAEMHELYENLSKGTDYNNLGEMLEFMSFYRNAKTINPELTLKEAFAAYRPDLIGTFDKYRSGTCILLSNKFCEELSKKGIHAENVGRPIFNHWVTMPIPGTETTPIKWMNFSDSLKGADHTDAVCHYKLTDGSDHVIQFACSYEEDNADEVLAFQGNRKSSAMDQYLDSRYANDSELLPNKLVDAATIGKLRLAGRFKAMMIKGKMTLGMDLLRGNLFINATWAKTIPGLPLNAQGMASIELRHLARPDETATYYINGKPVELTHREALRIFLGKAQSEMTIPVDMEENIITLAQNQDALFSEVFISPLPFIRTHYADLTAIGKKMKELDTIANDAQKTNPTVQSQLQTVRSHFDEILSNMLEKENFPRAAELIASLKAYVDTL
ncbi:MAG: hypothetical protein AB7O89_01895 [Parachlamydiales bacterium]